MEWAQLAPITSKIPRWVATEWQFDYDVDETAGTVVYSNPIPLKWKSLFVPRVCAFPNDIAFIAKLAIHQKEGQQYNSLQNMVQTNSKVTFEDRFHKMKGDNDMYVVELVAKGKENMEESQIRQPPLGTHLVIQVDMDTLFDPRQKHLSEMTGVVVADAFNNRDVKANFAAVVTGSAKKRFTTVTEEAMLTVQMFNYISDVAVHTHKCIHI